MLGFPGSSAGKDSACNVRDLGLIPGLGRSSGEENGNPLQYSCLENPMDRGTWKVMLHRVTKSQPKLRWLSMHTLCEMSSYHPISLGFWKLLPREGLYSAPGILLSDGCMTCKLCGTSYLRASRPQQSPRHSWSFIGIFKVLCHRWFIKL